MVFDIPDTVKITVEKQTTLKIIGFDKQEVGMIASKIKSLRIERSIFSWLKSLTFLSSQLFTDKIIYLCSLLINPDNLSLSSDL